MKSKIFLLMLVVCFVLFSVSGIAQNKYVGVKACAPCHKSEKAGKQFDIWQNSQHAKAFKTLTTAKADEIAKSKGSKKPAVETPECLECHTIQADAKLLDKMFDVKDGVQCEMCHGAGSGYKAQATMKDKAKAITAGLAEYKDEAAIEKKCKSCHNEKSPSYKEFKFKESWGKIKHPTPKKS